MAERIRVLFPEPKDRGGNRTRVNASRDCPVESMLDFRIVRVSKHLQRNELRILISYSRDDSQIGTAFYNLLQEAFMPIRLGISENCLSVVNNSSQLDAARKTAGALNGDLLKFLKSIEGLFLNENDYQPFAHARNQTLADLVCNLKRGIFDVLRNRVRGRSELIQQLGVRTQGNSPPIADSAILSSIANAAETRKVRVLLEEVSKELKTPNKNIAIKVLQKLPDEFQNGE